MPMVFLESRRPEEISCPFCWGVLRFHEPISGSHREKSPHAARSPGIYAGLSFYSLQPFLVRARRALRVRRRVTSWHEKPEKKQKLSRNAWYFASSHAPGALPLNATRTIAQCSSALSRSRSRPPRHPRLFLAFFYPPLRRGFKDLIRFFPASDAI